MKKELELYLHIPFCVSKCKYCDFLSAPSGEEQRQIYVERLCRRIRYWSDVIHNYGYEIVSIFVGGGTPSILTEAQITQVFEAVHESFPIREDAEITLEMNPGTDVKDKLPVYRELGINRLSMGLQSADNEELKCLGRIHTYEDFRQVYQWAREAGFTNINVDLMSAIPGQTLESYEDTLRKVADLEPEHISAYSLIIEEGTPFYERYGEGRHAEELPNEDIERQMYVRTGEILEDYGYHRYEISNYAKDGYECRHNLGYWDRKEYLGLGAGASSLMDHIRWKEPDHIGPSTGLVLEEREDFTRLRRKDEMEEFMFLGLRKINGVSEYDFYKSFRVSMDEIYKESIENLIKEGLLVREEDRIRLTDRGIDLSNYALSQFLLGE
ncbi:radical SAM family heme chaperone HemW [Dorea sp. AF36-15AT]|uniref:radical SAM family heme chaperone HemW n=1 Tax=Dorea sp. AF36-15AT TaxID=2292041 RepID=UPI000E4DE3C9|nr:radical SAM family heme chaperone HemW [Dorea sp. AF36-15AT]RHP10484.1 oxygen-independent coproporphyrinogen III oxidase [Dorea sp. AF36-15AT]